MGQKLFIAESPEELNPAPQGWIWIKPSTGQVSEFNDGAWAEVATLSMAGHNHPTLGDVNFTGTISADGEQGITGQRTIAGHTITFRNGILVGFS